MTGRARRWALRHLVGHDGEICHACGGRYSAFVWWADSALWNAVAGDRYGLLCPRCFTRLADEKGVWVCWAALPHDAWGDFVEGDVEATIAAWQRRTLTEADCVCSLEDGCDPGCAYCRSNGEWPCPAEMVPCPDHDDTEGPHHADECCMYAEAFNE